MMRIGTGSDTHRLRPGLPLVIGGVTIRHSKGFQAHSDGDILIHAIIDALLGAMGKGDIGTHFPDTNPRWKNVKSTVMMQAVMSLLHHAGFSIVNLDCTIHAQRPKLAPHIPHMVDILAGHLKISPQQINIKAKTGEQIGFIGREEGMHAQATVLIHQEKTHPGN